jgi:hypothetical protein
MTKDWEGFESPWEHKVPAEALEQPKEWQGLSDDEIEAIDKTIDPYLEVTKAKMPFARAIEAKLKEKNNG